MIKPLAKSVLIPLGLNAVADAGIHKKISGSGKQPSDWASHNNTMQVISND